MLYGVMRHLAILITIAALTLGCSSAAPTAKKSTPTPIPTPATAEKTTYIVQRGDITLVENIVGNVVPLVEKSLYFRTDGRVKRVYIRQGDIVKNGQVLAELEELTSLKNQQAADQLNVQRAQIKLEIVKLQLEKFKSRYLTPEQAKYDLPIMQYQVDLAQLDFNEVNLRVTDLGQKILDAQIISPMDGQILYASLNEGDAIKAFDPKITVGDVSLLEIRASLDTEQAGKLYEGLPITFSKQGLPGQVFQGKIRSLPKANVSGEGGNQDSSTRISIDTEPIIASLESGDYVQVTVVLENKMGVLWLPPQAIRVFEGREFVVVKDGDMQRRVDLKTGLKTEERVEIIEGLSEGQVVIAP
jgi:RND family efflux transporter MFP subunit